MDQIDINRYVIPKATLSVTQSHLANLKNQREIDPTDALDMSWHEQPKQEMQETVLLQDERTPQPEVLQQQEENEQAMLENLFRDMPEEVLLAARQILKGQMKSKSDPTKSLRPMKSVDFANVEDPEPCTSVLDAIMDAVSPLDMLEEDLAA